MRSSLRRAAAGEGAEAMCSSATSAINTLERVLRHQGRSASSQRQRKSSRWQQRAHVCAVLRRFDNTSLNGYQPLVVMPLVSARMSAAAPGKTKRIVTTTVHIVAVAAVTAQERAVAAVPQMWDHQKVSQLTQRQHRGCGRPSCEHSERFTCSVPLLHQQASH